MALLLTDLRQDHYAEMTAEFVFRGRVEPQLQDLLGSLLWRVLLQLSIPDRQGRKIVYLNGLKMSEVPKGTAT